MNKQESVNASLQSVEKESFGPSEIPIVRATLKECEKLDGDQETLAEVGLFLTEYFNQEIINTKVYESERYGASFPYTVVRLADVAKKLFEKHGAQVKNTEVGATSISKNDARPGKEFIFGTFFNINSAHSYHWIEHGIDQIAKKLPVALQALEDGEPVEDFEVYGMGNPAGELGQVSDRFIEDAEDLAFEHMGDVYADFISSRQQKDIDGNIPPNIRLWGVSMVASMAMTTAHSMIDNEQGTQSFDESNEKTRLSKIDVVMVSPVATSENLARAFEIPLGFVAEFLIQAQNSYGRNVASAEGKFITEVNTVLNKSGIESHMSTQDIKNKKQILSVLMSQLLSGIKVPDDLRTNEVVNIYDPLMYSSEFHEKANEQSDQHGGSLGQSIISDKNKKRRRFAVKETHTPKVVRENYFRRLIALGQLLGNLQKNHDK